MYSSYSSCDCRVAFGKQVVKTEQHYWFTCTPAYMEFKFQTGHPVKKAKKTQPWHSQTSTFATNIPQTPLKLASQTHSNDSVSTPKTSEAGSYARDLELAKYQVRLESVDAIKAWVDAESAKKTIEFVRKEIRHNQTEKKRTWLTKHIWVCARMGSGGKKHYIIKNPQWQRKVSTKRTGCQCRITFKTYPDTQQVLGFYTEEHDHPIGNENARFIRIPYEDRVRIAEMLRMGIEPRNVVSFLIFLMFAMRAFISLNRFKATYIRNQTLITFASLDIKQAAGNSLPWLTFIAFGSKLKPKMCRDIQRIVCLFWNGSTVVIAKAHSLHSKHLRIQSLKASIFSLTHSHSVYKLGINMNAFKSMGVFLWALMQHITRLTMKI